MENNEVEQVENRKKYRIGWFAIVFWVGVAVIFDLLTLIPIVGAVCGTLYFAAFAVYLWKTGHGWVNWKVVVPEALAVVAEWIPAIQALPAIVAGAVIIIAISRVEDKTGISIPLPGKKPGTTPPRIQKAPLNQGGVRAPR
ncbi:MAG: hypothetical protein V4697_03510 [Patescibacteria group bacterium]